MVLVASSGTRGLPFLKQLACWWPRMLSCYSSSLNTVLLQLSSYINLERWLSHVHLHSVFVLNVFACMRMVLKPWHCFPAVTVSMKFNQLEVDTIYLIVSTQGKAQCSIRQSYYKHHCTQIFFALQRLCNLNLLDYQTLTTLFLLYYITYIVARRTCCKKVKVAYRFRCLMS